MNARVRADLLLAHDLQRCIWLLGFVPQQYEAQRLSRVLRGLINELWPQSRTGKTRHRNPPEVR